MWIRFTTILLACLALMGQGCTGDKGPARIRVMGVVERRAEPLVNGTITFLPANGHEGPAANGVIQNGKFDIPAAEGPTVGPHQVLINLLPGKMSPEFAAGMSGAKTPQRSRWEFPVEVSNDKADYDFVLNEE